MRSFSHSQQLRYPCIPAFLLRPHSLLSADAGGVNTTGNLKCSNCRHTVKQCDTVQGKVLCVRSRKCFGSTSFARHIPWQIDRERKSKGIKSPFPCTVLQGCNIHWVSQILPLQLSWRWGFGWRCWSAPLLECRVRGKQDQYQRWLLHCSLASLCYSQPLLAECLKLPSQHRHSSRFGGCSCGSSFFS